MRSELSFFTIPALTANELFADESIRASTREVSDTTTVASSFTVLAEEALK